MLVFVDSDLETAPEKDASEKLSATGKRALKTPFSAKRPPVGGALSPRHIRVISHTTLPH
jgi:hypothetical protein